MILAELILFMTIAMLVGKRRTEMTWREYAIAFLLAAIQTAVTAHKLMTMDMPPLF